MPFGFQIAPDTLPSGTRATGSRSALAVSGFRLRARLGFSIPPCFPGQRGITPAFGYGAPHPSAEGTSTPLTHALPSTHYEPLRHPTAPGLSLAGVRLVIPDHAMGLPVLRTLSLCTCCRQYPGAAAGRRLRSSHPAVSAFPESAVGSACTSTFSRLARRSLALRPAHSRRHLYVTCYTEGFSHFVTSMTAPVASGWSVSPGGTCTHWKAPPSHGARKYRSFVDGSPNGSYRPFSALQDRAYERAGRARKRTSAKRIDRTAAAIRSFLK